jgi:serine/threonine protein kinase
MTHSKTAGDERGTPKYFAPEVANYQPVGRSADIFSLGCMFLEMVLPSLNRPFSELRNIRTEQDHSFQANLNHINQWLAHVAPDSFCQRVLGLIRHMIHPTPENRPTALDVELYLKVIGGFRGRYKSPPLYGHCCWIPPGRPARWNSEAATLSLKVGNIYHAIPKGTSRHELHFFVHTDFDHIISTVYVFLVSNNSLRTRGARYACPKLCNSHSLAEMSLFYLWRYCC